MSSFLIRPRWLRSLCQRLQVMLVGRRIAHTVYTFHDLVGGGLACTWVMRNASIMKIANTGKAISTGTDKYFFIGQSGVNPEWKDAVLHAYFAWWRWGLGRGHSECWANAQRIPDAESSAYLTLRMDTDSEAERVFSALSDGGQVLMPMREEFFASRFAQVRDRFGINWMILHERPLPQQQ